MSIIQIPNTFSPNTALSASEMNANFSAIYNEFNGNITAANLANNAITTAKLADEGVSTSNFADDAVTTAKKPRLVTCQLTGGSGQSPNSAAWTRWIFDTAEFDAEGLANLTDDKIEIAEDGLYLIQGGCQITSLADGKRMYIRFRINEDDTSAWQPDFFHQVTNVHSGGAFSVIASMSLIQPLEAGDYIRAYVWHNNGSARNMEYKHLTVTKLSD